MKNFERNKSWFDTAVNTLLLIGVVYFIWGYVINEQREDILKDQVAAQAQLIADQALMIERDDIIITRMLGVEGWERDRPVYSRWYIISTGAEVQTFTQHPDPDKFYELNF